MSVLIALLACGGSAKKAPVEPKPAAEEPKPPAEPEPAATEPAANEPKLPLEKLKATLTCTPTEQSVVVQLGQTPETLAQLYPTLGSVPAPYNQPTNPDGTTYLQPTVDGMIELFTQSSLEADQFTGITVTSNSAQGTVAITATGCNLMDYQTQLPAFLAAGVTGLQAWNTCLQPGNVCNGKTVAHPCTNNDKDTCVPCIEAVDTVGGTCLGWAVDEGINVKQILHNYLP